MNLNIKDKLKLIPKKPGCYLWKDKHGVVIYVGKAKNLANRTKQYFLKDRDLKTRKLVNEIRDVDYIVVNNENESLLLENNLITKYKPKYNMLLRETNAFPYIVVTKEEHPRILYTHDNQKKIKGTYYGPFANTNIKKYDLYNFINRVFPLRKCKSIPEQKCIYYDIGQCLGPCIKKVTPQDYEKHIKGIDDFFCGKTVDVDKYLEQKELECAEKLMFEDSQKYFELRKSLKAFSLRQDIITSTKSDEDVIGFHTKENALSMVIFKYVKGTLLSKYDITTLFYNDVEETITTILFDYYKNIALETPKIVYLSLDETILKELSSSLNIKFLNPIKGVKKDIMENALANAIELMKNKYLTLISNENRELNSLDELQKLLNIKDLFRIEIFDNSNLFNKDKVAAMVVYENGRKNKNEYRKYNIKNVDSNSDYEFMKEIIYRRFKRVHELGEQIPDLVIVDGGKPQVNAAILSLKELGLDNIIPVIGLAKDSKHKTDRIVKSNLEEIQLDKKSDLYFFLLNMQDEVHRFAISFHKNKRSKSLFENNLYQIKNLGKMRIKKLIEKYETIDNIYSASVEELSQIVPKEVAIAIKNMDKNKEK